VHVAGEGHAVACTCLIRGGAHEIELEDIQAEKTRAQGLNPDQGLQFVPEVTVTSSDDIAVTAEADIVVVTAGAKQPRQTARRSRTRSNAEETASTGPVTRPGLRALAATGARRRGGRARPVACRRSELPREPHQQCDADSSRLTGGFFLSGSNHEEPEMTVQAHDTPRQRPRPDAALDRNGPDDARRRRRAGTGHRPIRYDRPWATRGACRVIGSEPSRFDRTAAPVIYKAAAALPHDNREWATDGLRDQLRIMAGAAGATPDWTTLVVTGPTEMDGAPDPTRFEWTASVAVPGGSVLDTLPDPDALLTAWAAADDTMPFPVDSLR
jgi:hypothetical protein